MTQRVFFCFYFTYLALMFVLMLKFVCHVIKNFSISERLIISLDLMQNESSCKTIQVKMSYIT